MNTGRNATPSAHRLLTTIAWDIEEKVDYALEGSVYISGAAVSWLRDGLGLIKKAGRSRLWLLAFPTPRRGVRARIDRPRRATLG